MTILCHDVGKKFNLSDSWRSPIPIPEGLFLAQRCWEPPPIPPILPPTPQHVLALSHETTLVAMETHIVPVYWSLHVWGCYSHSTRGGWETVGSLGSTSPTPGRAHHSSGAGPCWEALCWLPGISDALLLLVQGNRLLFKG